jgi:hypothetical protein
MGHKNLQEFPSNGFLVLYVIMPSVRSYVDFCRQHLYAHRRNFFNVLYNNSVQFLLICVHKGQLQSGHE